MNRNVYEADYGLTLVTVQDRNLAFSSFIYVNNFYNGVYNARKNIFAGSNQQYGVSIYFKWYIIFIKNNL